MRKVCNKWQMSVTVDDETLERLDWMLKNCGLTTASAAIRFAIAEQYRRTNTTAQKMDAA